MAANSTLPRNTYRKSDVDLHPHNHSMVPAVNVKLRYTLRNPGPNYNNSLSQLLAAVRRDIGTEDFEGNDISWVTAEWLDQHLLGDDDALILKLEEWACQEAWEEYIQEDARQCFPDLRPQYLGNGRYNNYLVVSEGRSAGWAVIPALPPLEEWDAVMLARWRRFSKYARQGADDIPYQMLHDYLSNYAHAHMLRLTRERLGVSDPAAVHA